MTKVAPIKHPINNQIRSPRVRVIFETVNEVMPISQALSFARERGLDLVQFSAGECPTCRVMHYSKYKYQEEKKRKQEAGNKHVLKEIQVRPSISNNDLQVKVKHIEGFLEKGSDVRIRMKLRGREKANAEQHGLFLVRFAQTFANTAKVEGKIANDGTPIGGVLTLKPLKTPIKQ